MAQPAEDAQKSHIVINVGVESAATRCCCVCMEPLEWVAFGRCGHRDLCVGCAIRIRFFQKGRRRCCICRTYCPSFVVTHVGSRLDESPFFPRLPLACGPGGRVGRAGRYYWYHGGMEAYFDDQNQYEIATKLFAERPPPPRPADQAINLFFEADTTVNQLDDDASSQQPAASVVDRRRNYCDEPLSEARIVVIFIGIFLCVILFLTTMCGVLLLTVAETYYQKVAVGIAFGLVSAAATIYAIWCWPKFKATLLNC